VDWAGADREFLDFARQLIAFRKAHPILRQNRFLHAQERAIDGVEDLFWWRADGAPMSEDDWNDGASRVLCTELRTASGTPPYGAREDAIFLAFNAGTEDVRVVLPDPPEGMRWSLQISTATSWFGQHPADKELDVPGPSVVVCVLEAHGD
jgi:glycogen operon protein